MFTRLQLAFIHSLNQPTVLCMSPHLLLSECIFHQGIAIFRVLFDCFKFIHPKSGRVVKRVMNRPHQFMWRQETSSIFIRLGQTCFHSIDKFGRDCDVDQHRLQCSRVTQFCILLKYIVPVVLYILRARFSTQEKIESDLQSIPKVGFTDLFRSLHDAMKRDGYFASSFMADRFYAPDETAVIVAVSAIFVLDLSHDRDRQTERQNFCHRLCVSEQRFQRRLIGHDGGVIRDA